jgi:hypothetical protein
MVFLLHYLIWTVGASWCLRSRHADRVHCWKSLPLIEFARIWLKYLQSRRPKLLGSRSICYVELVYQVDIQFGCPDDRNNAIFELVLADSDQHYGGPWRRKIL